MKASLTAGILLACAIGADAIGPSLKPLPPPIPEDDMEPYGLDKRALPPNVKADEFQQLIDHSNPALGTFRQRYWWSSEFYGGPGSPVVFFTPGEEDALNYTRYATNQTITGLFAQAVHGALVVMEHRFFGESSPFTVLSTANLTTLTLNNSIKDVTYFAKNVHLPFDLNRTSTPDKAPWIMSGGSYSGALTAWISKLDSGTFWAYHASSAPVQAIPYFYHYWDPVRDGAMPRNCSADVVKLVEHIDHVFHKNGSAEEKKKIKEKMGMSSISDDSIPGLISYPLGEWQSTQFYNFTNSTDRIKFPHLNFTTLCDYVEGMWNGSGNALPDAEGVGLERAVDGWAKWVKNFLVDQNYCQATYHYDEFAFPHNLTCFDGNATTPLSTDLSLNNTAQRQWSWMNCNDGLEWYQVAPPRGIPSITTRQWTVESYRAGCYYAFPPGPNGETYALANGEGYETLNAFTGGWDDYWSNTTRLIWTNGELDPWRPATVSSDQRPGGPLRSTPQVPVNVIKGGIHCSDLLAKNGKNSPEVQKVIDEEVAVMKVWVDDFYKSHGGRSRR